MFLHVRLQFLDNGIEILLISTIFDTNNSDISLITFQKEQFLLCIPVLKCKFADIIDSTLLLGDPGRVFHTLNRRMLTVKVI